MTENGEEKLYLNYDLVEQDFAAGLIFPTELKRMVAREINNLLGPIRKHFVVNAHAAQVLSDVRKFC